MSFFNVHHSFGTRITIKHTMSQCWSMICGGCGALFHWTWCSLMGQTHFPWMNLELHVKHFLTTSSSWIYSLKVWNHFYNGIITNHSLTISRRSNHPFLIQFFYYIVDKTSTSNIPMRLDTCDWLNMLNSLSRMNACPMVHHHVVETMNQSKRDDMQHVHPGCLKINHLEARPSCWKEISNKFLLI